MIVVIIAGGSGTRLWPLSTPAYPKQLLNVNGDDRTLLQATYDRALLLTDPGKVYIVPEQSLMQHVKLQLPALPTENYIIEPARRGTASCILAALNHVAQRHGADEAVAVLSADHYIRDYDGFQHSFHIAAQKSEAERRIVLVGIEPDYPATGFGYIEKGSVESEEPYVFNVASFKEKPDYVTAQRYLKSGKYLWNCGYFVGSVATFREAMQRHAPDLLKAFESLEKATDEARYNDTYLGLETNSIDYALIEKVPDLLVVPAAFDWMDLGSFGDLHKAVTSDEQGNHVHGRIEAENVQNSFLQNHEDKPVAVIGLDNVVVVNTPHGILVARKDLAQKVGEISKRFNE